VGFVRVLAVYTVLIVAVVVAAGAALLWLPGRAPSVTYKESYDAGFRVAVIRVLDTSALITVGANASEGMVTLTGRGWGCRIGASREGSSIHVEASGSMLPPCWDSKTIITLPPGLRGVEVYAARAGVGLDNLTAYNVVLAITEGGLNASVAAVNLTVKISTGSAYVLFKPLSKDSHVTLTVNRGDATLGIRGNATVEVSVSSGHVETHHCGGGQVIVEANVKEGHAEIYCKAPLGQK